MRGLVLRAWGLGSVMDQSSKLRIKTRMGVSASKFHVQNSSRMNMLGQGGGARHSPLKQLGVRGFDYILISIHSTVSGISSFSH